MLISKRVTQNALAVGQGNWNQEEFGRAMSEKIQIQITKLPNCTSSTSVTADGEYGTMLAEMRYTAFGEVRVSTGDTPTDYCCVKEVMINIHAPSHSFTQHKVFCSCLFVISELILQNTTSQVYSEVMINNKNRACGGSQSYARWNLRIVTERQPPVHSPACL